MPTGVGAGAGVGGGGSGFGAAGAPGTGAGATAPYTPTGIFSTTNAGVGPASGPSASSSTPAPTGPASFQFHSRGQSAHSNRNNNNNNTNNNSSSNHYPRIKMEPSPHDLAAQEAAARDYQPELKGPLVGEKTPSTAITEEYAKADPVYVQKTLTLPHTYSHYRPIQGDGNCGWRAITFGYFEALITKGTKAQLEAEQRRLEGLNSYISNVGGTASFILEDFTEVTFDLMKEISELLPDRAQALAKLTDIFNTPDIAGSIIYHFRLLSSAWLKGHRDTYVSFITDMTVDGYCSSLIERPYVEIEQLGVILLVEVLLKPANFVLEIAYLDRSPGSSVNTYRFPEEANGQDPSNLGPMIHLLFRPDHYDIVYPATQVQPSPPARVNMDIQVYRATNFTQNYQVSATPGGLHTFAPTGLETLATMIPGFGAPPPGLGPIVDTSSPLTSYTPSPPTSWMPLPYAEPAQSVSPVSIPVAAPVPIPQTHHPLRFSEYCQLPEYVENDTWREPVFQSSTFKNSHFNVAHYNNPNFQPEEYKPENDEHELSLQRPGVRKRGSV